MKRDYKIGPPKKNGAVPVTITLKTDVFPSICNDAYLWAVLLQDEALHSLGLSTFLNVIYDVRPDLKKALANSAAPRTSGAS
jgi:hypothetical protein